MPIIIANGAARSDLMELAETDFLKQKIIGIKMLSCTAPENIEDILNVK